MFSSPHSCCVDHCQAICHINRTLATLRRRQQRADLDKQNMGLTPRMISVAVAVYVLSGYALPFAQEYAQRACRSRRKRPRGEAPSAFPIRAWFLEMPMTVLTAYHHPENEAQTKIRAEAHCFIAQLRSVEWIREQNFNRQVAPSSNSVVLQYGNILAGVNEGYQAEALVRSATTEARTGRRARRWCQKIRKRWDLSLGQLKCRDDLPLEEAQQRVRWLQDALFW
jgi:hypothetical protein